MPANVFGAQAAENQATVERKRRRDEERRNAGPWLHAWHDPVASIKAFTQCVRLCDVYADGEYRLLVAVPFSRARCHPGILKVYKGTALDTEAVILDTPTAMACFYSDLNTPTIPSVAVAGGPFIYIYRSLRPYYKFVLPAVELDEEEVKLWLSVRSGEVPAVEAWQHFDTMTQNGVQLSTRTTSFLNIIEDDAKEAFAEEHKMKPLVEQTLVTCMETLNKNMPDDIPVAISSLVVGTEDGHVLILDPTGTSILKKLKLPSVPVFMAVSGTYDVEYRIVVACRDSKIYTIKKGKVLGNVIELETQACGLHIVDKQIIVGCMDKVIHSFQFKGGKNYSIYLPVAITNMEMLILTRTKNVKCLLVALANGQVRLYKDQDLVTSMRSPDIVTAMRFGPYGRHEASLILAYRSGALTIKMLQRNAQLKPSAGHVGPPPEQDVPLNIPKTTKLFLEQTQREIDQAVDMHRIFQRDLCKLRLSTARAYVKVITDGSGPMSSSTNAQLRISPTVAGLGPLFKLKLMLKNIGRKPIYDVPVTLHYNPEIYQISQEDAVASVPVMIPGLEYKYNIGITCIDPNGAADAIRIFVCRNHSAVPTLSAIINMPQSELPPQDE